ncbi:MAG: extracellular solute-binding protein [Chloroflexi bacterium]|nr:extracellular solute-binding protein [Chloroflexota bacterium]
MNTRINTRFAWPMLSAIVVAALILAACGGAATSAPSGGGGGGATKHVSILNKDMTDDEIKAEIKKEGSLVVANWTYTANDELVKQFKQYVKDTYGVDVEFTYEGSQAPSTYLTNLYAAQKAGNPSPYDVMAIEENYWAEAMANKAPDNYLPSDLIPNQKLILDQFQHVPTTIAFQSTAFPGIVYNKKNAPYLKSLKDLADPRLKGKLTLPLPGDITAGGFFLGVAAELGKDYKDPAQMKEVVDWVVTNISPNVLKYTTDSSEMQQLLRSGAVDAVSFWNSLARLEYFNGYKDTALLIPSAIYPANGYLWIPKGAAHPVLAQIFINWRLSPEVQFPNKWPIDHGPWSELSEGFLGPSFEGQIPDWFKADYYTYFPTLDQIKTKFKQVDWDAYNASSKDWQDYYA